jgi:hypothetical protein
MRVKMLIVVIIRGKRLHGGQSPAVEAERDGGEEVAGLVLIRFLHCVLQEIHV